MTLKLNQSKNFLSRQSTFDLNFDIVCFHMWIDRKWLKKFFARMIQLFHNRHMYVVTNDINFMKEIFFQYCMATLSFSMIFFEKFRALWEP